MSHVWDYDVEELKKSAKGRIMLLERKINYGVFLKDKERIDLSEVKKNWKHLNIDPQRKKLFKLLIWGK